MFSCVSLGVFAIFHCVSLVSLVVFAIFPCVFAIFVIFAIFGDPTGHDPSCSIRGETSIP